MKLFVWVSKFLTYQATGYIVVSAHTPDEARKLALKEFESYVMLSFFPDAMDYSSLSDDQQKEYDEYLGELLLDISVAPNEIPSRALFVDGGE